MLLTGQQIQKESEKLKLSHTLLLELSSKMLGVTREEQQSEGKEPSHANDITSSGDDDGEERGGVDLDEMALLQDALREAGVDPDEIAVKKRDQGS